MLANHGVFRGTRILSAQAVEAMAHDYTPDHHGYGLTMSVAAGVMPLLTLVNPGTFGHGGAFGTNGTVDPKNGLITVFLPQMVDGNAKLAGDIFTALAEASVQ